MTSVILEEKVSLLAERLRLLIEMTSVILVEMTPIIQVESNSLLFTMFENSVI